MKVKIKKMMWKIVIGETEVFNPFRADFIQVKPLVASEDYNMKKKKIKKHFTKILSKTKK